MLQKTKCWIIIYFTLLKCTSSNTVFHTIENRAFALPILLVQLVSPSLEQAALLHSPFSGSDVYGVASAMAWGFTSPRIKSDNSPPLISVPRLSIPAHQPQLASTVTQASSDGLPTRFILHCIMAADIWNSSQKKEFAILSPSDGKHQYHNRKPKESSIHIPSNIHISSFSHAQDNLATCPAWDKQQALPLIFLGALILPRVCITLPLSLFPSLSHLSKTPFSLFRTEE